MTLKKATLIVHDKQYTGEAQNITFMFNPTEISFTRTVNWERNSGNRSTSLLPKVNFSSVSPYELTLSNLMFDTYESGDSVMSKYIDNIKQGVSARAAAPSRPPVYIFSWDKSYFHCVMSRLSYKLTMFLPNGTPVRAIVDITLQEVDPANLPGSSAFSKNAVRQANPALG
ncbi:hypothetical protein IQ250_00620 [Pseudanabaenaceae cyanobacterium LEGE 13415]|nr:hypothetical protein [Pseudanabaenaceae cyanobacterium LEGE 13415]